MNDRLRKVRELMDSKGLPHGVGGTKKARPAPRRGVQVSETVYPPGYRHGDVVVDDLLAARGDLFRYLGAHDSFGDFNPAEAVYVDTETTGLAGGAGTFAFLVGAGFFSEKGFVVRQYFMPEPGDEREMLERLAEDLKPYPSVVTFNGARFDLPLLHTRFIMQGMRPSWRWRHHLDLLPLSRRLWRGRLESFRLARLEEEIVGFAREGDVPGAVIPSLYVRFLQEKRLSILAPVLTHNAWDIVSMAALSVEVCRIMEGVEDGSLEEGWDYAAAGRAFSAADEKDLSLEALLTALGHDMPGEMQQDVGQAAAALLKSAGRRDEASEIWSFLCREHPGDHRSRIELAMHLEHCVKDAAGALTAAREARDILRCLCTEGQRGPRSRLAECERRVKRLQKRVDRAAEMGKST